MYRPTRDPNGPPCIIHTQSKRSAMYNSHAIQTVRHGHVKFTRDPNSPPRSITYHTRPKQSVMIFYNLYATKTAVMISYSILATQTARHGLLQYTRDPNGPSWSFTILYATQTVRHDLLHTIRDPNGRHNLLRSTYYSNDRHGLVKTIRDSNGRHDLLQSTYYSNNRHQSVLFF